ncbi:MAG: FG-GAP repeat protein [Deltaproteobacteria bacterium]|nr:FG-GAP repeat protein [Deltaproteobacteria bacterium]
MTKKGRGSRSIASAGRAIERRPGRPSPVAGVLAVIIGLSLAGCGRAVVLAGEPADVPTGEAPGVEGDASSDGTDVEGAEVEETTDGPPPCGNLRVDPGEECDDANDVPGDGCEPDCRFSCHADADCVRAGFSCAAARCDRVSFGWACGDVPATDGTPCDDGSDCTVEDSCRDGTCSGRVPMEAPRPLWPRNGAYTGTCRAVAVNDSLRPVFAWTATPPPGGCLAAAAYELQVDDGCSTPGFASCRFAGPEVDARGLAATEWRPAADLPVPCDTVRPVGRRYYWRVRACFDTACTPWSRVAYLEVGREPTDFDGDGYADAAVAALQVGSSSGAAHGALVIYAGSPEGPAVASPLILDPAGVTTTLRSAGYLAAGDSNADGFADLAVGDPDAELHGAVTVLPGSATGLSRDTAYALSNPWFDSTWGLGSALAWADINGDGFADLLGGAPDWHGAMTGTGIAFWLPGSAEGVEPDTGGWLEAGTDIPNADFGAAIASAGDLDDDGFGDVVVGAPGSGHGTARVYVFRGSAPRPSRIPALVVESALPDSWFPPYALSGAADLNGDRREDLLVGAPGAFCSHGEDCSSLGVAVVHLGDGTLLSTTPSAIQPCPDCPGASGGAQNFGGSLGVVTPPWTGDPAQVWVAAPEFTSDFDGSGRIFQLQVTTEGRLLEPGLAIPNPAEGPETTFGFGGAVVGDTNGDGWPDAVFGAMSYPNGCCPAEIVGRAWWFPGSPSGLPPAPARTLVSPFEPDEAKFGALVARAVY